MAAHALPPTPVLNVELYGLFNTLVVMVFTYPSLPLAFDLAPVFDRRIEDIFEPDGQD